MKKFKVPHVYVIITIIIIFAAVLTYILPAGSFERYVDEATGRTLVQAGSYAVMDSTPVSLFGVLQAVPQGMVEAASVIFIVFVFGGSFGIINATGAIESGIESSINVLRHMSLVLIPALMIIFAIMGGFLGMIDCLIVFVPICVMFSRALGYDAMVGFAALTVGNIAGFACGPMCMWNTGVAQGIAELPIFSAFGTRMVMFVLFVGVGIAYVMRYALKVRKNPELSVVYELELRHKDREESSKKVTGEFTTKKKVVLGVIVLGFIGLIVGVLRGWSAGTQISGYLLGMAIVAGFVNGFKPDEIAEHFVQGARDVVMGALVVGLARAILVILTQGNVIDTILFGASTVLGGFSPVIGVIMMFVFQFFFNFIIYSGSGQAATTMPLMVPLADLIGVTRQSAVVAFQLGDGLSNALWPTAGPLMAGLSIAEIPYSKWLRWFMPLMVIQVVMACVFAGACQMTGLGPF
ncbi:C4-dicarboxylate ABC transporter permease [Lachnospiraceae bacterium NSJ-143]|nr:C4-dicarboxylate ABC transporter permease [Lachnospiraceae bacterium NSJ-143]